MREKERTKTPIKTVFGLIFILPVLLMISGTGCEDNGTNYENISPNRPSQPDPNDGAANQPIDVQLYWSCSDPDGDPIVYSVYFGQQVDPPLAGSNISDTTFSPGQLEYNTVYYWKVEAFDPRISRTGPIWHFTTATQ